MKQLPVIQRSRKVCVNFVMVGRTDPSNSDKQNGDSGGLVYARVCARVCVCVRVCSCVRACVRACERASEHACVRGVFAIYDNNSLPRLIMIIIKIIFLYFIEIAHIDDFPATGTRLVRCKNLTMIYCVSLVGRGSSVV